MKIFHRCQYVFLVISLVFLLVVVFVPVNFSEMNKPGQEVFKDPQYVMAQPGAVAIDQSDATRLTIVKTGDEVIHYNRTMDGYTLLPGKHEVFYYAMLAENRDLVISSYKANDPGKRSKKEEKFLEKLKKYLEYSEKQKKEKKDKWKDDSKPKGLAGVQFGPIGDDFPSTGSRNMLVILGAFSDWSFVKTNSNFNNLMNVGISSFKAYYQDNSYNSLNVTTTVVGPYTINMTMAQADANIRSYIAQCVDAAENAGVNFANFDNDNDGNMDALYVIHAGYGEENTGAPSWYIWSHSWSLSAYARTYDGVYINSYATSPELRGIAGSTISAIGVICHEFGHNIGVPDYYDTDGSGSGGSAWDLQSWDVMAGGSWNNNGDTPAQHCMYTKWKLGWSNPTVISSLATLTLGNTTNNNQAYRINTTTSNEFFILENRQQIGWDAYLPGHGLFIFHIDGNFIDGLSTNTVNANPSHQGVDIEEADDIRSYLTYGGDPFPGTGNKTSFTDATIPSSKSWAGVNTNKPVTNISENSGVITFDFMGGGGPTQPPVADFTSDKTIVQVGGSVNFTDLSTNIPTSWAWTFAGGTPSGSSAQNPTVTYNTLGTYTVILTATNSAGSDTETKIDYITVQQVVLNYCSSLGSDYTYEWIKRVVMGPLDNTSGAAGYTDFTSIKVNLTAGGTFNVSLTPEFPGFVYTEYWKIWIDYNVDGDFTDPGEEVFSGVGTSTVTGSITVPPGIGCFTRMRVSMKWASAPTPCEAFSYGEVEDYSVVINSAKTDFNQDGYSDIIWRYYGNGGYNAVWLKGATVAGIGSQSSIKGSFPGINNPGVVDMENIGAKEVVVVDMEQYMQKLKGQVIEDGFAGNQPPGGEYNPGILFHPFDIKKDSSNQSLNQVTALTVSDPRDDPQAVELIAVDDQNWKLSGTGDFNGDGNVDIVWSNVSTAHNCVWYMNGTNGTTYAGYGQLPDGSTTDWVLGGVGDFDQDGHPDMIWHNVVDGRNGVWYLDGVQLKGIDIMTTGANVQWQLCGTGDFNNDGHVDLVWRNIVDGRNAVWYMDGVVMTSVGWLGTVADQNWKLQGTGDFNNDGKIDLVWTFISDGRNCVWHLDGITLTNVTFLTTVTDTTWMIRNQ